jgi:hypothetical protein
LLLSSCQPPQDSHIFWWNWWATFISGVGTLAAVMVALYATLRSPKPVLKLTILHGGGEINSLGSGESVRYYHLKVSNEDRSTIASKVQVFITRIEEEQNGIATEVWRGDTPLRWRDQEYVPKFRPLGSAKDCDICSIAANQGFMLQPLFWPNSLVRVGQRRHAFRMIVSVQARSNQVDSPMMKLELRWNGQWDQEDMVQNFTITEIPTVPDSKPEASNNGA